MSTLTYLQLTTHQFYSSSTKLESRKVDNATGSAYGDGARITSNMTVNYNGNWVVLPKAWSNARKSEMEDDKEH